MRVGGGDEFSIGSRKVSFVLIAAAYDLAVAVTYTRTKATRVAVGGPTRAARGRGSITKFLKINHAASLARFATVSKKVKLFLGSVS